MIKTGNCILILCFLFINVLFISAGQAQDISVSAVLSETNIFAGESVMLDVKVKGQSVNSIDRPQIPRVDGLRWLNNTTGQSTEYSYSNGQPVVTYTFNYSFIAETPGNYTFPALALNVNGQRYTTNAVNFKILDPQSVDYRDAANAPDIYVRLEPSTTSPVVGEQVIADIVLYFKNEVEVSSYQASPGWKAEGFWKEDFENRQQARTTSTIISGVRYQRAKLLQYAIFPTKSGELTLSPFEIVVQIRQRNRRRDIFSFGLGQERKELITLPVTINVRPLPPLNNAINSGAVGKFQITRTMNPEQAFVGESVEITTTISGQGNIPLIIKPLLEIPGTLETYEPQESSTLSRNNRQISGSKTFTDIVIARNEGEFEIPAANIAYFDPDLNRYNTIRLPALLLNVERDPRAVVTTGPELRFNVQPITGLANWVQPNTKPLAQKTWVWVLLILPVLILTSAWWVKTYNDRMKTDSDFARSQKAKTQAHKMLGLARESDDLKTGYHHIEKALTGYITDKLGLPKAGLSSREIVEALAKKIPPETSTDVRRLLDKCETISYAPNTSPEGMQTDCEHAEELIKTIGKQL